MKQHKEAEIQKLQTQLDRAEHLAQVLVSNSEKQLQEKEKEITEFRMEIKNIKNKTKSINKHKPKNYFGITETHS